MEDQRYLLVESFWSEMEKMQGDEISLKQTHQQNEIDTVMKLGYEKRNMWSNDEEKVREIVEGINWNDNDDDSGDDGDDNGCEWWWWRYTDLRFVGRLAIALQLMWQRWQDKSDDCDWQTDWLTYWLVIIIVMTETIEIKKVGFNSMPVYLDSTLLDSTSQDACSQTLVKTERETKKWRRNR